MRNALFLVAIAVLVLAGTASAEPKQGIYPLMHYNNIIVHDGVLTITGGDLNGMVILPDDILFLPGSRTAASVHVGRQWPTGILIVSAPYVKDSLWAGYTIVPARKFDRHRLHYPEIFGSFSHLDTLRLMACIDTDDDGDAIVQSLLGTGAEHTGTDGDSSFPSIYLIRGESMSCTVTDYWEYPFEGYFGRGTQWYYDIGLEQYQETAGLVVRLALHAPTDRENLRAYLGELMKLYHDQKYMLSGAERKP